MLLNATRSKCTCSKCTCSKCCHLLQQVMRSWKYGNTFGKMADWLIVFVSTVISRFISWILAGFYFIDFLFHRCFWSEAIGNKYSKFISTHREGRLITLHLQIYVRTKNIIEVLLYHTRSEEGASSYCSQILLFGILSLPESFK